jgi:hypothetical protein
MITKRPKKPQPKLMAKAEQELVSQQAEAARLGRLVIIAENRPMIAHTPKGVLCVSFDGLEAAKARTLRLDMTPARARGDAAFKDGLLPEECPFPDTSPERSEWMAAYEQAKARHEQRQGEIYR